MKQDHAFVLRGFVPGRDVRSKRAQSNGNTVPAGVGHEGLVVSPKRFQSLVDLCRWVQMPKFVLLIRASALATFRAAKENLKVMLAAGDLVEQMNVVHVCAPVDVIVLVSLSQFPHRFTP